MIARQALQCFLTRLSLGARLSPAEQAVVVALPGEVQQVSARRDLVRPGQTVDHCTLVADGLLARYDLMRDGARQITAFHVPGDMCDLHSLPAPTTGWGITALSAATVVSIPHEQLRALFTEHPSLAIAFWRDTTLDASILAKWIANIGRKDSLGRVAHLLCEMGLRIEMAGRGTQLRYHLAATQEQIGDATGLTGVHVNRMLRELRESGLATVERGEVSILDWDRLAARGDFDATYLLRSEQR